MRSRNSNSEILIKKKIKKQENSQKNTKDQKIKMLTRTLRVHWVKATQGIQGAF